MNRSRSSQLSRAELVRQRQNERSQQRVTKPKKNATNAATHRSTAPIHTRGVVSGFNYSPPVQQRARKQYYYTVGANGTEIRMPALPSIKLGWRLLSFLLLIAALTGIYFLMNAPFLQIETITVNGINRVTTADIENELELIGKSIVLTNPEKAVETLALAFPELYDVEFLVEFPNQITINAIERQPIMAWQTEQKTYWIDQEGFLIPPRGENPEMLTVFADLDPIIKPKLAELSESKENETTDSDKADKNDSKIIVALPQWGDQIDPITIQAAYQLQTKIPTGTNIIYDKTHGMGWRAEQGWEVFIGLTLNDIEYKLKAYDLLINKLNTEGITPTMVSVEYVHAPFYRE